MSARAVDFAAAARYHNRAARTRPRGVLIMAKKKEVLSDTTGLTQLGHAVAGPSRKLEAFPFHQKNKTRVTFLCSEFTCNCPLTGQPDYATIEIEYIPRDRALESKSLKNYLWSFRDTGVFHEDLTNVILNELFEFLNPEWMKVTSHFNMRGGIAIDVEAERKG
jgi:7-cyano-7-deazaguanine reductase